MLKWTTLTSVEILLDTVCPVSSADYVRENHSKRISLLLLFTKIKINVWKNWNIESHENMTIHECCLSNSLYVSSDIMSKARMWKKSKCITLYIILFIVDNLLQLFIGKEQTCKAFPRLPEELKFKAKKYFFCTDIDSHWASWGNICTFSVYWPTCVFPSVSPLKLKNERCTEKISMDTQWKYKSMKYVNFVIYILWYIFMDNYI